LTLWERSSWSSTNRQEILSLEGTEVLKHKLW
jgi:hypothetical protein